MRVLYWAPRILAVLFALLLSVFALDVLGEGYSFWEAVVGLLIHLAPTFLVILVLVIAWRWEWLGALLFFGLAAFYVIAFWAPERWAAYLIISGPLALVGLLFLADWLVRVRRRGQSLRN